MSDRANERVKRRGGFTLQYIKVKFHITTVLRESVPIGNASVIGL